MTFLTTLARRSAITMRPARLSAQTFVRNMSYEEKDYVEPAPEYTKEGALIAPNVAFTIEWILSSPPPLHAFEEPPIFVEWPEGEADGHH